MKDDIKAISIVITAYTKLDDVPSGFINARILATPGEANAYSATCVIPANNPPKPSPITAPINGFYIYQEHQR